MTWASACSASSRGNAFHSRPSRGSTAETVNRRCALSHAAKHHFQRLGGERLPERCPGKPVVGDYEAIGGVLGIEWLTKKQTDVVGPYAARQKKIDCRLLRLAMTPHGPHGRLRQGRIHAHCDGCARLLRGGEKVQLCFQTVALGDARQPSRPPRKRTTLLPASSTSSRSARRLNVLDALREIGRLVVCARRSVAGRVSQCGRADIRRRANFAKHGLEGPPERVRRDVDPEPRLRLPRPLRPVAYHGAAGAGKGKLVGLAGPHRPEQRDQSRGQRHNVVGQEPSRLRILAPQSRQRPHSRGRDRTRPKPPCTPRCSARRSGASLEWRYRGTIRRASVAARRRRLGTKRAVFSRPAPVALTRRNRPFIKPRRAAHFANGLK